MIEKMQRSFIRSAMLSVTLVLILLIGSVNLANWITLERKLDGMLTMLAENRGIMPSYAPHDMPGGPPKEPQRRRLPDFDPETPFSTRFFVLQYTKDGTLLHAGLEHIASVTEADMDAYLRFALSRGEGTGYRDTCRYRIRQMDDGTWLAVFLDCRRELQNAREYALASVLALTVCIALVYGLILALSRKAMAPAARSIEKQKQFITDAGHELKTPLTVITTSLRVLEMDVGPQKWIDKAQAQTECLRELVDQMVALSRLDEEKPPMVSEFCISDAVRETAESFQDFAAANGLALGLTVEPRLFCTGDEYAVRQLVSILLDNAVKYSDGREAIRLSLEGARKELILRIRNSCPEINADEADRLFDRFYRVDRSRSRQSGGFGIGLSIARGIVEAHGGSIRAGCPDTHSIEFTVLLKRNAAGRRKKRADLSTDG